MDLACRLSELVKDGVSAVVSPAALAGCLRVDSVYMATSIPTSALQLEVGTLDVTLLNHYHAEGNLFLQLLCILIIRLKMY